MTRRRWLADEFSGNHAVVIGSHADHLSRVLRARIGQEFDIVAGAAVRRGRITSIGSHRIEFELSDEIPAPAMADVTLLLSIFRFDRMEWAIEKCTELGVSRIAPIIAQRTETHLAAAAPKRRERWLRIARQACEQSRRAVPPEIISPTKLKNAVELMGGSRVVLAESEKELALTDALSSRGRVLLAIGPEGGWTEPEIELFGKAGWTFASLGPTILRAETAAVAATAVVMASQSSGTLPSGPRTHE